MNHRVPHLLQHTHTHTVFQSNNRQSAETLSQLLSWVAFNHLITANLYISKDCTAFILPIIFPPQMISQWAWAAGSLESSSCVGGEYDVSPTDFVTSSWVFFFFYHSERDQKKIRKTLLFLLTTGIECKHTDLDVVPKCKAYLALYTWPKTWLSQHKARRHCWIHSKWSESKVHQTHWFLS